MRRFSSRTLTQVTRNACKFWLYLPSRIEAPLQLWGRINRNYLELKDVREDIVRVSSLHNHTQCTLQMACRRVILKAITMSRIHFIHQLPLPSSLRAFLSEPNFVQDYDLAMPGPAPTDENITFFIRHFHYHPNHLARKIHVFPTVSNIDDTYAFIKIHHTEGCQSCAEHHLSKSMMTALQCFKSLRHKNVQHFYGMVSSPDLKAMYLSLERTKASFFHVLVHLAAEETEHLPEDVVSSSFSQMCSVLYFISAVYGLYIPVTCRSFLIDFEGNLKLENPLAHSHNNQTSSPENILENNPYKEFHVTWSLGCVLYNMAALLTLDEEKHSIPRIEHGKVYPKCSSDRCDCFSANYQPRYSKDYAHLLQTCLNLSVETALPLERITIAAQKYREKLCERNSGELSTWLNQYFMTH